MAQSVIGALRVNLGLDSAKFESGARRVKKPLQEMKHQFQAVAALAAAAGAAISAAALAGARDIDKAAKSARRLDSSIGGFRALELAAGEAGVSLASMTNDIQTIDREIAAIGKSGNAARALSELGLAASDLTGLDADEKLATIADRIKELGLSSGEATSVLRDLGVRNREMVLLMGQGGDAIRKARQDIKDYGLAVSEVDSSKIEAANDAIGRLGLITQYIGQQLAITVVPAMGRFAQAITDSLREGGALRVVIDGLIGNLDRLASYMTAAVAMFGVRFAAALIAAKVATFSLAGGLVVLRGAIAATGIGLLIIGMGEAILWFNRLVTATGGWGAAMSALGDLVSGVWEGIKTSASAIAPAIKAVWADIQSAFFGMLDNITGAWAKFLGNLAGSLDGVPGMGAVFDALNESAGRATETMAEFNAKASSAAGESIRLNKEASGLVAKGFEKAGDAAKRLLGIMQVSSADMTDGASAADSLADALGRVESSSGGGAGGGLGDLGDGVDDVTDGIQQLESASKSAFAGLVTGAKTAREALSDVLNSFATMLANRAFESLFGGLFGGVKIPGFATGTDFAPGGLAMVGERGPELVTLPRGSRVTPNHELGDMGGTSVVRVELGEGLEGRILQRAGSQAVQLVSAGMAAQDRRIGQNFENYAARNG